MDTKNWVPLLLVMSLFSPHFLKATVKTVEYSRDVYYNSDPQSGFPLDIDYHTGHFNMGMSLVYQERLHLNLAAGLTPFYLKGSVKVKFIWDTDSVGPGASFTVKVVAETDSTFQGNPDYGGSSEIYSNYGFQAGISLEERHRNMHLTYGIPSWSSWEETPIGLGLDLCLNIRADGKLPMHGEELSGGDIINIASVGADVFTGGKAVKDQHGNPLDKDAASSVLGLLNLLSIGVSGYYKLQNGVIHLEIVPVWPFSYDPAYSQTSWHYWQHRGDTVLLHLKVDPLATNADTGYFEIPNGYVQEDIYYRIADHVDFLTFHEDFYSTDWMPLGNGSVDLFWSGHFPVIPVPVSGESQSNFYADLYIDPGYLSMWHTRYVGPHIVHIPGPEVGGWTGVGITVKNQGNITSGGYIIRFVFQDSVEEEHRDGGIPPGGNDDVAKVSPQWQEPGEAPISVYIIPDSSNHDPNVKNDSLNFRVFIRKHRIPTLIAVVNEITGDTITPSDSSYYGRVLIGNWQTYTEWAVPDTTYNHWDRWLGFIPEDANVNITAIPASNSSYLVQTTKYVRMDTVSTEPFWIYLPLIGKGVIEGIVTNESGDPVESTLVSVNDLYFSYTNQDGYYMIDSLPANQGLGPYYIKFFLAGYRVDSVPVNISNFDTLEVNHQLTNVDTIPPFGEIICDSIVTRNVTLRFSARDTFTQFGDTLPPARVMVRDGGSSWQTFDYGFGFMHSIYWSIHTRTSHNEVDTIFAKFVDNAGNVSDSVSVTVVVDQDGPNVHYEINHGSDTTANPEISITDVNVVSSIAPVWRIIVEESGVSSSSYNYIPGTDYPFTLNTIPGNHTIHVKFVDSLGVVSPTSSRIVYLEYSGRVLINNDAPFTDTNVVNLSIEASSIVASNSSGDEFFGGYPLAQSFIAHTNKIYGISIYVEADSGLKVGIYRDSTGMYGHIPVDMLVLDTLNYHPNGWISISYSPPLNVNPEDSYMIVMFQDSIHAPSPHLYVKAGPADNYDEGDLYYYMVYEKQGEDDFYFANHDMLFKILGGANEMFISNDSNFNSGTGWIPYDSYYPNWVIPHNDGIQRVFVKIRPGDNVLHDAIILDELPPSNDSINILNHLPYLESTECTLRIYARDTLSGIDSYSISGSQWQSVENHLPEIIIHDVESGAPGPRSVYVRFKDRAGNISSSDTLTVDYDPEGPQGAIYLGNEGFSASETVSVFIDISKFKGKSIRVDSMKFSPNNRTWTNWLPFNPDTNYIFNTAGLVGLWIKLKDKYNKTSVLSASCIIDTTPPDPPYRVRDEGYIQSGHDSLSFWWECHGDYQSGISHYELQVSTDIMFLNNVYTYSGIPPQNRYIKIGVPGMRGDSTYYARVIAVNRAGLRSQSDPTDGIRILNGISQFELISPADSSSFQQGDTINLTWHKANDILSRITLYRVYVDDQLVSSSQDTTWQLDFNLDDGWHRWYVVAQDSLLDERSSDTSYFYVGTINPPPVPVIIWPEDTFINYDTVRFVWSPGTKELKRLDAQFVKDHRKYTALTDENKAKNDVTYTLQVSSDSLFSTLLDSAETGDTAILETLPEGRLFWRVRATNAGGSSDWSATARFTIDTTPPSSPEIISPAGGTLYSDTVSVLWHASTDNYGIASYRVYYWGTTSGEVESADTSVSLILGPGSFYLTVSAIDSAGNISVSDTSHILIEHISLPTPVLISPENDSITNHLFYMRFVWSPGGKRESKKMRGFTPSRMFVFQLASFDSTFGNPMVSDTTTDTTLILNIPEGRLYWRVREIDGQGNVSQWSSIWVLVGDTTRPTIPEQVSPEEGEVIDTNVVHFVWHSSRDTLSGFSHYLLEYSGDDSSGSYSISLTDTEVVVTIPRNGEWSWDVVAFDSANNWKFSGYRSFTVNYQPPLPVPELISPVGNMWVRDNVLLRWQVSTKDTLSYIVEVTGGGQPVLTDTTNDDSLFVFLGSGHYLWHVRTYYGGRVSDWSPADSFRVDAEPPGTSAAIFPQRDTYIVSFPVTFIWSQAVDELSGIVGYHIILSDNFNLISPVLDTTLSETTCVVNGPLQDGEWYWQIEVIDSAGNIESNEITNFFVDTEPPPGVHLIAPEDSIIIGNHVSIVFAWQLDSTKWFNNRVGKREFISREKLVKEEVVFDLYIIGISDTIITEDISDTTYTLQDSLPDGWYTWFIIARDNAGNTRVSDTMTFCIDFTSPTIESTTIWPDTTFTGPFNITTKTFDENGINQVWLFFAFGQHPHEFDSTQMVNNSGNFYGAIIPEVNETTVINYFVKSFDNASPPNFSFDPEDSSYHFIALPVGVRESGNREVMSLRIFPNPTSHDIMLRCEIPIRSNISIRLYNASGQVVFQKDKIGVSAGTHKIIIRPSLRAGVYFVEVRTLKQVLLKRLVILK